MDTFDRTDERDIPAQREASDRLTAFTRAMWETLVPESGACLSVQGELVRSNERLYREHFRNAMCNYFDCDQQGTPFAETHYGGMVLFILETMIENRNDALAEEDVAYFVDVHAVIEAQWKRGIRVNSLWDKDEEGTLTDDERDELERLAALPRGPHWEMFFARAERCIANWCLKNSALCDRQGNPVVEAGFSDVHHVLAPRSSPQERPVCATCGGKGWVPGKGTSDFPVTCTCKLN